MGGDDNLDDCNDNGGRAGCCRISSSQTGTCYQEGGADMRRVMYCDSTTGVASDLKLPGATCTSSQECGGAAYKALAGNKINPACCNGLCVDNYINYCNTM